MGNELYTQLPGVQLSNCNLSQPNHLFVREWYGPCIIRGGVINTNQSGTWEVKYWWQFHFGPAAVSDNFLQHFRRKSKRWNEECFILLKFAFDCEGGLGNMCLTKGFTLRSNATKVGQRLQGREVNWMFNKGITLPQEQFQPKLSNALKVWKPPPRPAPRKAPQMLGKPVGRDGAKLTLDSKISECPTNFISEEEKEGQPYLLVLCIACEYLARICLWPV